MGSGFFLAPPPRAARGAGYVLNLISAKHAMRTRPDARRSATQGCSTDGQKKTTPLADAPIMPGRPMRDRKFDFPTTIDARTDHRIWSQPTPMAVDCADT